MKRNFLLYLLGGTVLTGAIIGGIQVLGQTSQYLPPNSTRYASPEGMPNLSSNSNQQFSPIPLYRSPGQQPNLPPNAFNGPANNFIGPSISPMYPGGHSFVVNKDGTIQHLKKGPGESYTPEEMQKVNEARRKLQKAVSQMKSPDAKSSEKSEAKEFIAKFLKAEFQADQESRREQLARLEKQVDQLKQQLTKRDEAQNKLIELRLQLLENDATGLAFPDAWGSLSGPPPGPPTGNPAYSPINAGPYPTVGYGPAIYPVPQYPYSGPTPYSAPNSLPPNPPREVPDSGAEFGRVEPLGSSPKDDRKE